MAKYIAYVGLANYREVGSHDLAKTGLEDPSDDLLFEKGKPTKMDDAEADVLLSHELFIGEFEEVEEPQPDELDYEDWSIAQLKDELGNRELPTNGKKAALVERLRDHDSVQALSEEPHPQGGGPDVPGSATGTASGPAVATNTSTSTT